MMFKQEPGRFYINEESGKMIAEITYKYIGEYIAATHTFVDPVLRGQGIAQKLVDEVVRRSRSEGKKIDPVCPYVKNLFEKDMQYSDVYLKR